MSTTQMVSFPFPMILNMHYVYKGLLHPLNYPLSSLELITFLCTIVGITALGEPWLKTGEYLIIASSMLEWEKVGYHCFPRAMCLSIMGFHIFGIRISSVFLNVWGQKPILSRSIGFEDVSASSHLTPVCTGNRTHVLCKHWQHCHVVL